MHNKLIQRMWKANFWQSAMFFLLWLAALTIGTYLWINHGVNSNNKIAWVFLLAPLLAVIMYIVSQVRFACELNALSNPDKHRVLFPIARAMKLNYSRRGSCLLVIGPIFLLTMPAIVFFSRSSVKPIHLSWVLVFYFCWLAVGILNRALLVKTVTGKLWNKPSVGASVAMGVLVAAPIAVYLFLVAGNINLERRMNAELAADKAQGRVSYLEDALALPRFNRPSPIEDAIARFYDTNARELDKVDPLAVIGRLMYALPTSEMWVNAEGMLKHSPDTIALIDKMSSYSEASFEYNFTWEDAALVELPHLAIFRSSAAFNNLRMLIAANNGDSDAAFAHWRRNLNLQKQLSGDIFAISPLVLNSIDTSTLMTLNRCIAMGAFSDDQLREIAKDLQRFEPAAKALAGFTIDIERLYAYNVFYSELMREDNDMQYTAPCLFNQLLAPIVRRGLLTYTISRIDEVRHIFSAADIIEPYQMDKDIFATSPERKRFYQRNLPGMHLFEQVYGQYSDLLARGRATQVLIAAELFRRSTGELPRLQTELVPNYLPALPIDPHTGKPLIYEFTTLEVPLFDDQTAPAHVLSVRSAKVNHDWTMHRNHTGRGAIRFIEIVK